MKFFTFKIHPSIWSDDRVKIILPYLNWTEALPKNHLQKSKIFSPTIFYICLMF